MPPSSSPVSRLRSRVTSSDASTAVVSPEEQVAALRRWVDESTEGYLRGLLDTVVTLSMALELNQMLLLRPMAEWAAYAGYPDGDPQGEEWAFNDLTNLAALPAAAVLASMSERPLDRAVVSRHVADAMAVFSDERVAQRAGWRVIWHDALTTIAAIASGPSAEEWDLDLSPEVELRVSELTKHRSLQGSGIPRGTYMLR